MTAADRHDLVVIGGGAAGERGAARRRLYRLRDR
jgi:succinate dehydrogenase/fumarate reductase flavoprotein subunit